MTVQNLTQALNLAVFHLAEPDRPVTDGYCGDLLSWVMSGAPAESAWMTIMSNMNVAAVAALTDVSCVILTDGVSPDAPLLAKAQSQGINLVGSSLPTYQCAAQLAQILK